MINNFDNLVARCTAMRRRRMIRISLIITGTILALVALVALYVQWSILSRIQTPAQKPSLSKNQPASVTAIATAPIVEQQTPAPQNISYSLPAHDSTKARAFVIQLTSSKSYTDVNATRHRIPSKYLPSLAIYAINGFYTLRYIDIYDLASLPHAIEYFKSLGFSAPTAYKYNPERVAISDNAIPKLSALPPSAAPITNEVPIPVTPPPSTAPVKYLSGNRVFSVQTSNPSTTADFITTYRNAPKYETALTIARDFYAQENYVDAAIWAKKANQLNREAEEAWLLYAKSYYAQGRKSEAINILELYLNYKDSKPASELVRTWKLNSTH